MTPEERHLLQQQADDVLRQRADEILQQARRMMPVRRWQPLPLRTPDADDVYTITTLED